VRALIDHTHKLVVAGMAGVVEGVDRVAVRCDRAADAQRTPGAGSDLGEIIELAGLYAGEQCCHCRTLETKRAL
jgi:hypothetical protein